MGKQEDLLKIERTIKDAEAKLKNFSLSVNALQKEKETLVNLERQLEENLVQLKKTKVIAMATEYKKAKEDLKKTKTRLIFIKADIVSTEKAQKDFEDIIEKNKEVYDKLTKASENNVLSGKFGKSRA